LLVVRPDFCAVRTNGALGDRRPHDELRLCRDRDGDRRDENEQTV
jgi:hypothetical protein